MQRLAVYSRERLHELTRELKLDYERGEGYLVLLRTAKDLRWRSPGLTSLTRAEHALRDCSTPRSAGASSPA